MLVVDDDVEFRSRLVEAIRDAFPLASIHEASSYESAKSILDTRGEMTAEDAVVVDALIPQAEGARPTDTRWRDRLVQYLNDSKRTESVLCVSSEWSLTADNAFPIRITFWTLPENTSKRDISAVIRELQEMIGGQDAKARR